MALGRLETSSLDNYFRQWRNYVGFCKEEGVKELPIRWEVLAVYFEHLFRAGRTTRSNAGIQSALKHFCVEVIHVTWLSSSDELRLGQARRTLMKFEASIPKKARPLYGWMLEEVLSRGLIQDLSEFSIFAMWVFALGIGARFGELSAAKPKWQNLAFIEGAQAYVLYYAKAPKANKTREAPCSLVSARGNPFGFAIIHSYAQRFRTLGSDSIFPPRSANGAVTSPTASISSTTAVQALHRWLREMKVPGVTKYTGHSARRGMLNDKRKSTPIQIIAMQGHWAPGGETAKKEYGYYSIAERSQFF